MIIITHESAKYKKRFSGVCDKRICLRCGHGNSIDCMKMLLKNVIVILENLLVII